MEIHTNDVQARKIENTHEFYDFQVTVNANSTWQNSGIDIVQGEILNIEYSHGVWNGDGGRNPHHGPAGPTQDAYTAPSGYPLPGVVEDSLIGKLGDEVFFVGNQVRKHVRSSGRLHLGINDIGYHDNSGSITMNVSIGRPI